MQKRHTPEQIIQKLRLAEKLQSEGQTIAQVCQRLGVSEQTFHRWRNQYGGMKADAARRLKELEAENIRLKRLVADLTATFEVSQRRACEVVGLHRSRIRQRPAPREDEARLVEAILELVGRHPRYGYRRIWVLLVRTGLVGVRGAPGHIRSDNGPEFIAGAIRGWLAGAGVETLDIEPGSPWENGYAESFHSRVRDEFLGVEEFASVTEAMVLAGKWRREYNHERPHSSLGYKTPAEYGELCPRHDSAARCRVEDTIE